MSMFVSVVVFLHLFFLGLHIWLGVNEWMNEWMNDGFYGDFRVRVLMEYLWLVFQVSPPSPPPPTRIYFFLPPILWYWEFGKKKFQKIT
jgi:hypothetical protein